jgi:hypothetical protein
VERSREPAEDGRELCGQQHSNIDALFDKGKT